jgi:hypothetical protein
MINQSEFEMLCACCDVAIKQSTDSRQTALKLNAVLLKLEKVVDDGDD